MSDPKQLKFQFTVDEASLQKTRQLIRELTADLIKLNSEAGKAGSLLGQGGGAGVSVGTQKSPEQQRVMQKTAPVARPVVQGFLDQKQIFKGIADGSKESLRATDDAVKQSVSKQKQELDSLERSVKRLRGAYKEMMDAARGASTPLEREGRTEAAESFRDKYLQPIEARYGNARRRYDVTDPARRDELQRLEMEYGGAGAGGAGGGAGGGGGPGFFGARQLPNWAKNALKVGGLLIAGASMIQNENMAGITGMAGMEARRADIVQGQMARLMGGDVKLTYAMKNMDGSMRKDLRDINMSTTGKIDTFMQSAKQVAGGVPIVGGLIAGKGGNGGIGGAFTDAEVGSYQAEKAIGLAEAHSKSLVMENFAMDRFQGQLGARISAGRQLGLGRSRDKRGQWVDSYQRLEDRLSESGYSVSEYQAAKMSLQGMGGERFGFQYGGEAMRANAQGLGGYAALLAAGQRAGVGGDFARGAIGGGIDANAGIALGTSIIGTGFDPRGTTTGMGALMAAQGGFQFTGNASDFNVAQRAALGLGAGDALTTGGLDPYQRSRNLVSAIRGNAGMNIYGQDYLANGMSMKQMIDMGTGNSPMTATAQALGLSPEMIKKQLGASVSSVVDRYRDTGANDPMSNTIRQFRSFQGAGKGGISDFFNSLSGDAKSDAVRNMGAFFGLQTGQGDEAGLGLMGFEAGLSNAEIGKLKKGAVGRGIGQTEKDAVKGMADASKEVTKTFEQMGEAFNRALKDIPADFTKFKNFNDRLDASATKFIESLGKLTTAIETSTAKMGGGFKTGAR